MGLERLKGLDPTGPLGRGFVLVRDAGGRPITSASRVTAGSPLRLTWRDGEWTARPEAQLEG